MNEYIKNLMECSKTAVGHVFMLADRISSLCGEVFGDNADEMQFDPNTFTYILTVGFGEYRIHMDLNTMSVEIIARSLQTSMDIAFCRVGINGAFKTEYSRGSTSVKTAAFKLFDLIEDIDIASIQKIESESCDTENSEIDHSTVTENDISDTETE